MKTCYRMFISPFLFVDKHMKEWLAKLLDCGYFDQVVVSKDGSELDNHTRPGGLAGKVETDFETQIVCFSSITCHSVHPNI